MSVAPSSSLAPGTRILYQNQHLGTVRYSGTVDGTPGEWLGVEWDDAEARGKHDGVRDGKRYFQCRVRNAGSFIRYNSAAVDLGQPFLRALTAKYVGDLPPSGGAGGESAGAPVEHFTLGSSKGRIEVEAPGLDKVRRRLANIEKLREISLDGEGVSCAEEENDATWNLCRNVRGLNLSKNLIPTWNVITAIVRHLPILKDLNLDRSRYALLHESLPLISTSLRELRLNQTLLQWSELQHIAPAFPNLEELQMAYNHLGSSLIGSDPRSAVHVSSQLMSVAPPSFAKLHTLFLDGNGLDDWTSVICAVSQMPMLQHLHLSENALSSIPPVSGGHPLEKIRSVNLASNSIKSWSDVNSLAEWLSCLESLSMANNPLVLEARHPRQMVIARIGSIVLLDGGNIQPGERQDSELYYLSDIVKSLAKDAERAREHPRWLELCAKHGKPSEYQSTSTTKLSGKLIGITLLAVGEPLTTTYLASTPAHTASVDIRVLRTMTVRVLRLKAAKTLKSKGVPLGGGFRLWALLRGRAGGDWVVRELEDEETELEFAGLEEGSCVAVLAS